MLRALVLLAVCGIVLSHDSHHDHDHHSHHHDSDEAPHFKYSQEANTGPLKSTVPHLPRQSMRSESSQQLWMETGSAVALISVAPFLLLCLIPDLNKYQCLLRVLLAFAAGGLLGDAFLHLIPHALDAGHSHNTDVHTHDGDAHTHGHTHDHKRHTIVGFSIISGIFLFLCVEKLIRLVRSDGHGHSHATNTNHPSTVSQNDSKGKGKSNKQKNEQPADDKKKITPKVSSSSDFRVAGYLNLAADFTHNFTDGMAIGASFLISRNAGMMTTLTVLIHELPHEIGDYAILIQSGCSARKAMCLQLVTALGAALGASLSLIAAGIGLDSHTLRLDLPVILTEDVIATCLLPFTAGGFIYIAMTSVLPDLLNASSSSLKKQSTCGWFRRTAQSLTEVVALVTGVGMMALLGVME